MCSMLRQPSSTATSFFTGSFDLEDETKVLSDYVIGQRLGEGAYGSVYTVTYIPSGDRFALKILQKQDLFSSGSGCLTAPPPMTTRASGETELDPLCTLTSSVFSPTNAAAFVKTFEQQIITEAMVMQALEHPNVVKFYKFLNSSVAFYFVMELAEGGELFDLILSQRYFNEEEARKYFQQLVSAIDYCHRNGVAHKDLKAENLLLSNDGRLLVCDFGFSSKSAKENVDDPEETFTAGTSLALLDTIHNGTMYGTLHYLSPEAVLASTQRPDFDHFVTAPESCSPLLVSSSSSSFSGRGGAGQRQASPSPYSTSHSPSITPSDAPLGTDVSTAARGGGKGGVLRLRHSYSSSALDHAHHSTSHRSAPPLLTPPPRPPANLSLLTRSSSGESAGRGLKSKGSASGTGGGLSKVSEGLNSFVKSLIGGHHSSRRHHGQASDDTSTDTPYSPTTRRSTTTMSGKTSGMKSSRSFGNLFSKGRAATTSFDEMEKRSTTASSPTPPTVTAGQFHSSFPPSCTVPPATCVTQQQHHHQVTDAIGSIGSDKHRRSDYTEFPLHCNLTSGITAGQQSSHHHHHRHLYLDRPEGFVEDEISSVASPRTRPRPVIVDPFQQDLWSAGVILFFMLTGRLPFDGRDDEETLFLIQQNTFSFQEEEMERISAPARQLVTRMLSREPTERPTTEQIIGSDWFQQHMNFARCFPHRPDLQEMEKARRGDPRSPRVNLPGAGGIPSTREALNSFGSIRGAAGGGSGRLLSFVGVDTTPVEGKDSLLSKECSSLTTTGGPDPHESFAPFLDFSTNHTTTPEEERVLETAFRKIDSDGYGCITRDQVRDMLTTLHGDAVATSDVEELVRLFTGDPKSNSISFTQFRDAWVSKDLAHMPFTHSSEFQLANIIGTEMDAVERQIVRQLRAAFNSLDESHSGVVRRDQLCRIFERCNVPVLEEDCASLVMFFHESESSRELNMSSPFSTNLRQKDLSSSVSASMTGSMSTSRGTCAPRLPPRSTNAALSPASPNTTANRAAMANRNPTNGRVERPGERRAQTGASARGDGAPTAAVTNAFPVAPLVPVPPPNPSNMVISFDAFVHGIVKSDILLKHPLGRKLAAATNLAALFQSRNVTECVRHGFLVTGLQNVILEKLASLPDRLMLLYSDEVVSGTENIYSFRYLGSAALEKGATMNTATPMLMSSSLVAVSSSVGGGGTLVPPVLSGSQSASLPQRNPLLLSPFQSSFTFTSGGAGTSTAGAHPPGSSPFLSFGANSNAGSLSRHPAPSIGDLQFQPSRSGHMVNQPNGAATSDAQGIRPSYPATASKPSSAIATTAPVLIAKNGKHGGTTATAASIGASSLLSGTYSTVSQQNRSTRLATSQLPESCITTRDLGGDDDTKSFFSSSRHSSSIVSTSDDYSPKSVLLANSHVGSGRLGSSQDLHGIHKASIPSASSGVKASGKAAQDKRGASKSNPGYTTSNNSSTQSTAITAALASTSAQKSTTSPQACSRSSAATSVPSALPSNSVSHPPAALAQQQSSGNLASAPSLAHRALSYGGSGAVQQVNGICDVDILLSPACLGYTMVQFRRIHGKTSDFHEAVTYISNLLDVERQQANQDTMVRGESELM